MGIAMWVACILVAHQLKLYVDNTPTRIIYNTIVAFFLLNALFSIAHYALIVWETGALNAYRYQGDYQKYFIRTGDYIKGITLDTSTTNAVMNAFGVIFFLSKRNWPMLFVCMFILILTVSNVVNIMMIGVFAFMFLFRSDAVQKSFLIICIMLGGIFMVKISPENYKYVKETIDKITNKTKPATRPINIEANLVRSDSALEQKRRAYARLYLDSLYMAGIKHTLMRGEIPVTWLASEAVKPKLITPDINAPIFQSRKDTTARQQYLINFIRSHAASLPLSGMADQQVQLPGKFIALQQTLHYLRTHKDKILTGNGAGTFSSKLAFRMTGLGLAGSYPTKLALINPDFLSNHLDIYFFFFSKDLGFHSLMNTPNSVYIQLLSEYGLIGLVLFLVLYLGFFAKHYRALTYGIPLLIFGTGVFFMEYWFEQFSIVVLFELLLMLDIKETSMLKQLPTT
jgi:ABC-type multidrug transport system fused ATPase/permease subunit